MVILYLVKFIVISTICVEGVFWYIYTKPVVFGDSVELICNYTSGSYSCKRCTKRWYGGPELKLIAFDGITSDAKKYTSVIEKDHFNLIIRNFSIQDVFVPYVCTYGFVSHTRNLTVEDDFEFLPTKDTMVAKYDTDGNSRLHINVDFKEVFPMPNCSILINEKDVSNNLIRDVEKLKFFYHVSFKFSQNITESSCKSVLHMDCNVGTKGFDVIHDRIGDMCKNENLTNVTHLGYIVGGTLVVVCIFVITTCYIIYVQSKRNMEMRIFCCCRHFKEISSTKSHRGTCHEFELDEDDHDENFHFLTEHTCNKDYDEIRKSYQDTSTNKNIRIDMFQVSNENPRQSKVKSCRSDNSLYLCMTMPNRTENRLDSSKVTSSSL